MPENMHSALEKMFQPAITLRYWAKRGRYTNDLVANYKLFNQFRAEAGIGGIGLKDFDFDKFCQAAGRHGYAVEVIEQ